MSYLVIIALGLIEQIFVMILCKEFASIEYEEIYINYSVFKFKPKEDEHYGINMLIRIFFPVCFIIVVSGILYESNLDIFVHNIYFVTIVFYIFRWANIILIQSRTMLHYWRREFMCFVFSMILSLFVYYTFITKTRQIFISIDALRDAIWFAIISLFVGLVWSIYKKKFSESIDMQTNIRERYIYAQLSKFKTRYNVKVKDKKLNALIYAVMIYENFNRPPFIRIVEYIKCLIFGHATLGIMQVSTNICISNKQSIEKGVEILKQSYYQNNKNIEKTIGCYNGGSKYEEEVKYIYNVILDKYV